MRRLTIEQMQAIAKERGGKCLSKKYVNDRTKLEWECASGHRWKAIPGNVRRGSWCPTCANRNSGEYHKLTIQDMQKIAKSRSGKCLSKKYVNNETNLKWECAEGHRWKARPSAVKNGSWCAKCYGNTKKTIEQMRRFAESKKGKCISKKYVNSQTNLKWECARGHQWLARPAHILSGQSWCSACSGKKKKTIEQLKALAKERGGRCLSKNYKNAHAKYEWECGLRHRWEATFGSIQNGTTWCPECSAGISERICREYFRQLFGKPFPKCRPKWLKNNDGNQMELDGYCKELRIAFEHQGKQHDSLKTMFTKSQKELSKRIKLDKEKVLLCEKNGVRLIAIPQLHTDLKLKKLQRFIYDECMRLKIRRPAGMLTKKMDIKEAWISDFSLREFEYLKRIAKSHGGKCLSKVYIGAHSKMEWECSNGHRWHAIPANIKNNNAWCKECAGLNKKTIEQMQAIAKEWGGKCLSMKYVNQKTKLEWQCSKGHRWWAASKHIVHSKSWCPQCQQLTIEDMQAVAKSRGGKCLSKKYVNSKTKLQWECAEGHKWKARQHSVRSVGTWCAKCSRKRK